MILRTKINVTHSDESKKLTGGTKEGIVTMTINRFVYSSNNGVEVPFEYTDEDGNALRTEHNGIFRVPAANVKALSQSINAGIPDEDNIEDRMWSEIKAIASNEMKTSFGITDADIEEVV